MVLVTGSTGHLGNVLVRLLLDRGYRVRVLVQPTESLSSLSGHALEVVVGDVREEDTLVAAFRGIDVVFHLAGIVSILKEQRELLREVNIGGTRNVISACRRAGVRRLVYTSSVHAFSPPDGSVLDESSPILPDQAIGEYGKSKAEATLEVLRAAAAGLDAVVVCPAGIIGPFDYRRSRMGRVISLLMRSSLFGLPEGAYNFVDVRDIAQGELLAAEQGRRGEVYILSGEKIRVDELVEATGEAMGRKATSFPLPLWLCRAGAALGSISYNLTGKEPLLTEESLAILRSNCDMSSSKAEREISYRHRPLAETLLDTVEWHSERRVRRHRGISVAPAFERFLLWPHMLQNMFEKAFRALLAR